MFDFSWSELLLIGVVALVFIGPKELPGVLRTFGQWMSKVRRMASEFQNQFHDAMREAELADLKKEVEEMAAQAANYSNIDPLGDVRKEMETAKRDVESAVAETPAVAPTPVESATPSEATVVASSGPAHDIPAGAGEGGKEKESVTESGRPGIAGSEPA